MSRERFSRVLCAVLALMSGLAGGSSVTTAALRAAPAATCTWTGGASGNWSDAAKWSCGSAPGAGDSAVVGFGAGIALDSDVSLHSLSMTGGVISGTHALSLTLPLQVNAQFGEVALRTVGSRIPALISTPESGAIFRLTDPALADGVLQAITATNPAGSNGSTVLQGGPLTVGDLTLAGNLSVQMPLTVTGVLSWSGGSLSNGGLTPYTITLAAGGVMTMAGLSLGLSLYAPFVNAGQVTWLGAASLNGNAGTRWRNDGVLVMQPSAGVTFGQSAPSDAPFVNTGVLRKLGGHDVQFDQPFDNFGQVEINGGAINMRWADYRQYAGHTRLNGGALSGVPKCCNLDNYPSYLYGGDVSGSGVITGGVENRGGTLQLDGALTMTGAYLQSITGTLQVTMSGATSHGTLAVVKRADKVDGGRMAIDGTLIVNKAGGFEPASGDRFTIATGLNATGAFQQSSGTMAPAFSGFAGAGSVIVAEPDNAAFVQARPGNANGTRGAANSYAIAVSNPTTQTLSVGSITVNMPVSFTYVASSTTGVITGNPFDSLNNAQRQLFFVNGFTVPPGQRREFAFGIVISDAIQAGSHTISVDATTTLGSVNRTVSIKDVAPIAVPLGALSGGATVSGATVQTQGGVTTLVFPRSQIDTGGITVRVRIVCPVAFQPCGNLSTVYLAQEVNGRYINVRHLQLDPDQTPLAGAGDDAGAQRASNDYGFWTGYIPGGQFMPGQPEKIYPDWDAHRPCIAYDFSGFGIRPTNCVGPGDDIGTPFLYDPSGIVRDAVTSQPIAGATVTLYRVPGALPDTRSLTRQCRTVDTRGGSSWPGTAGQGSGGVFEQPGFVPAQIDPNVNPQVTGVDGRYGWNVVTGCWYVQVSAPGYVSQISTLVGVPPEVTDLDITLTPGATPERKVYLPLTRR